MSENRYSLINIHCKPIKQLLLIANSMHFAYYLQEKFHKNALYRCDIAMNNNQAKDFFRRKRYDIILIDLDQLEAVTTIIDWIDQINHRAILISSETNEVIISKSFKLKVIDYIYKSDEKFVADYLLKTLKRLNKNRTTTIGICDDSALARSSISQSIETQNLPYIEFSNGKDAYEYITNGQNKVDILLTDYEMPLMNGFELIRSIRQEYSSDTLPILAISGSNNTQLIVQFLKFGASDFIQKPFDHQQLCTRLNLMLNQLYINRENAIFVKELEAASTHDYLTGLYNRTFFYAQIKHITAEAQRQNKSYGIVLIDIDHFKKINDTYGHHAGDMAIIHLANILTNIARTSDYCIRWGGEEFLILVPTTTLHDLALFGERLRAAIENSMVFVEDESLSFDMTISVGIASGIQENSQHLISEADQMLYVAKSSGRNCVKYSI